MDAGMYISRGIRWDGPRIYHLCQRKDNIDHSWSTDMNRQWRSANVSTEDRAAVMYVASKGSLLIALVCIVSGGM